LYWGDEEIASDYSYINFADVYGVDDSILERKAIMIGLDENRGSLVCRDGKVETYENLFGYTADFETVDGTLVCSNDEELKITLIKDGEVTILNGKEFLSMSV
jgi:hypothetical protein